MKKKFEQKWWHKSVVYQIYPKSFNDTTGSGEGDIRGIIEKLDYLKELGVEVLWITPMYKSPQNDNGYDISDYYDIDPNYGTMEDFEEMLAEAHKRGLKIVMDIVVNHSSTENEWFKKSEAGDPEYKDFYIWKDAVDGKEPTNWQSKFGGNAWQYSEKRGQYYLHLFDVTQADLNWENENVIDNSFSSGLEYFIQLSMLVDDISPTVISSPPPNASLFISFKNSCILGPSV